MRHQSCHCEQNDFEVFLQTALVTFSPENLHIRSNAIQYFHYSQRYIKIRPYFLKLMNWDEFSKKNMLDMQVQFHTCER